MSSAAIVEPSTRHELPTWKRILFRPADYGWLCLLLLSAWCGVLFFYGLTAVELWRTENLRAIIAEGMLRSGDWIVPRLYGVPLFTKPPGMYVAIALCSWPFGEVTECTARLPSALAATATVFLFYCLFSRYVGRLGGLLAGLMLPMSLMYLDKAPTAEIDMLLVAWVVGAVVCFLRAVDGPMAWDQGRPDATTSGAAFGWWLGALLCVAGGVLTKWTAAVFFYGMAISLLWRRGQLRLLWSWQHVLSALAGASVCLAWIAAAIASEGWEVFSTTVLNEALPRIIPNYQSHHEHRSYWLEVILHPVWLLATALPWSVVAVWTLRPGFARLWDERGRKLLTALHCWTWPNLVFWSLMSNHTVRHSFPLFPGLAGLAAMVWLAWWTGKLPLPWPRMKPIRAFTALLAAGMAIKVVYVEMVMPRRNVARAPRAKGRLLASIVPVGSTLYLFRLKDEGIMFYFGGTVVRLESPAELPCDTEPVYCILDYREWEELRHRRPVQVLQHLTDEQGDHIVLVRLSGVAG
jgi:4-amino-4-deoxy-L-arabinose transferase-like glycosyltransferase